MYPHRVANMAEMSIALLLSVTKSPNNELFRHKDTTFSKTNFATKNIKSTFA